MNCVHVSFSQLSIPLGNVLPKQRIERSITIDNLGGMPSNFSIDLIGSPPWAKLTVRPDPSYTFPVTVKLIVNTHNLRHDIHRTTLRVNVDGQYTDIPLFFTVTDRVRAAPVVRVAKIHHTIARLSLAAFAIGAIAVMSIGMYYAVWSQDPSFPSTPTPALRVVVQPASRNPVTSHASPPAGWQLVREHVFSAEGGWYGNQATVKNMGPQMRITGDRFQWTLLPGRSSASWALAGGLPHLDDYYMTVRVRPVSGSMEKVRLGIIFRNLEIGDNYAFLISGQSQEPQFSITTGSLGFPETMKVEPLPRFDTTGNTLTVLSVGGQFYFSVNANLVASMYNIPRKPGLIGLTAIADDQDTNATFVFDKVEVYSPQ